MFDFTSSLFFRALVNVAFHMKQLKNVSQDLVSCEIGSCHCDGTQTLLSGNDQESGSSIRALYSASVSSGVPLDGLIELNTNTHVV
jgi:hypothetical protein